MRPDLEPLPEQMRGLPVDQRGYPVPHFVAWIGGKPDFRIADSAKWSTCVKRRECWVCGGRLGVRLAFAIGPMCGINRTTAEPPSHLDCARWSARNCPFLSRPHMTRRDDDMTHDHPAAGLPILRNPGVTLVWVSKTYSLFLDHTRKPLIRVGDPLFVEWYAERRLATRAEVDAAVESGLPLLVDMAGGSLEALVEIRSRKTWLESLYPAGTR